MFVVSSGRNVSLVSNNTFERLMLKTFDEDIVDVHVLRCALLIVTHRTITLLDSKTYEVLQFINLKHGVTASAIGEDRFRNDVLYMYTDTYNLIKLPFRDDDSGFLMDDVATIKISSLGFEGFECRTLKCTDMFLFAFGPSSVKIIAPDYRPFGQRLYEHPMTHITLIGKDCYFVSDKALMKWDMTTNKYTRMHTFEKPACVCLSATRAHAISNNELFTFDRTPDAFTLNSVEPFVHTSIPNTFTYSEHGTDFNHASELTKTSVPTIYRDQMDSNEQWMSNVLCKVAGTVYTSGRFDLSVNHMPLSAIRYDTIFVGNDAFDVPVPPRCMFHKSSNYQHISKDMTSLIHMNNEYSRILKDQIMNAGGMKILPTHKLSGLFHLIWPTYAKGWHHNIESVPKRTVDVVYFVATDINVYGGSFFYYRHPVSHAIHAVPDINGTMKFFLLNNNAQNPLWHAIASFTARRVSLGLSRLCDMETELNPPRDK